ncbi:MAG TPA: hypothetical protein PKV73_01080 [Agriterribacter sp.]|nr:hypothetical protein [Agriterribacter sp.]
MYIFTLDNTPTAGDKVLVTLVDGNGVEREYEHNVISSDSLQSIVDSLMTQINSDGYFTAQLQVTYDSPGLIINQVTTNNYGLFMGYTEIIYGENSITSPSQTITFSESRNDTDRPSFEGFTSFKPECMVSLGVLFTSFKGGKLWTHDSSIYNSFYGEDYESSVTFVFNDNPVLKKTWMNVNEVSSVIWDCPQIETNVNSYGNTKQQTSIAEHEFEILEGNPAATIKRDANSIGGKWNGDFMKGNYCAVTFRRMDASELVYLNTVSVYYKQSQLTPIN